MKAPEPRRGERSARRRTPPVEASVAKRIAATQKRSRQDMYDIEFEDYALEEGAAKEEAVTEAPREMVEVDYGVFERVDLDAFEIKQYRADEAAKEVAAPVDQLEKNPEKVVDPVKKIPRKVVAPVDQVVAPSRISSSSVEDQPPLPRSKRAPSHPPTRRRIAATQGEPRRSDDWTAPSEKDFEPRRRRAGPEPGPRLVEKIPERAPKQTPPVEASVAKRIAATQKWSRRVDERVAPSETDSDGTTTRACPAVSSTTPRSPSRRRVPRGGSL